MAAGPAGAARIPRLAPTNAAIAGPDASIVSLNGLAVARDGTGGAVYIRDVGGVPRVFVSILTGGSFQAPVEVDAGLAGPSSQPVIAAGNQGTLLVGFVNGGALYVAQRVNGGAFSPPGLLYPAAANPSISMSNFGKAYLAFTATNGAGGGDVRTAYYYGGQWALESTALDASPADAAGTGSGRPQVATAGDGTAIVVWGENGHIYTRRVVRTAPSVAHQQADVSSLDGWSEVASSDPVIATGGDSSYASVSFREQLASGSAQTSRVLFNRLHAGIYDGVQEPDGAATGGPEGTDQPQTSDTEYGVGWVVSEHDQTHALFAAPLASNDSLRGPVRIDSLPNAAAPDAVSANAGLISTLIAWQQTPGGTGPAEIRLRYAADGRDLGPEQVASSPAAGATDADAGLQAAGDVAGDAAVAWVQGTGADTRIMAAQLFQAPGGFSPAAKFRYFTTPQPTLAWSPANELWGPVRYVVRLDGAVVGETTATSLTSPAPLTDGRHVYQVTAVNAAGGTSADRAATVFVDTVHPRLSVKLAGVRTVGHTLRVTAAYKDVPPPGLPPSAASGVKTVYIRWGDGSKRARIRRTTATHIYTRARTYTIRVTATDRAGNSTVVTRRIKIASKAKPKRRKTHGTGTKRAIAAGARSARLVLSPPRPGR